MMISVLQTGRSIAPGATEFEMIRLHFAVATFFLATQLFATQPSQMWLWGTLAVNGAASAFFGIAQQSSWNGRMYWTIPLQQVGQPFSSFVNRNNAAGYLCICLAAAVGFAVWNFSARDLKAETPHVRATYATEFKRRHRGVTTSMFALVGELTAPQLFAGAFTILITTGILLAMSRGGWLALLLGTVATFLFASKYRGVSTVVAFVAAAGLSCLMLTTWIDRDNQFSQRVFELTSSETLTSDKRWDHWQDSLRLVWDFPLTGTGFGSYQFAYLPYQSHPRISGLRFFNADNMFLEWLVEGGAIGLSIVLLFLLLASVSVVKLLRSNQRFFSRAVGLTGVFLIVSQCVSAFFDFGPTMPANAFALAALFGALTGYASAPALFEMGREAWWSRFPAFRSSVIPLVLAFALLLPGIWQIRELGAAAATHSVSRQRPKLDSPDSLDETSVTDLIHKLSTSMISYPSDADAHKALADLLIYRFRLQEFAIGNLNPNGRSKSEIWSQTSPVSLLRQVSAWEQTEQFERIELLVRMPTVQENLVPAFEHLLKAQSECSLIPDVDQNLAILAFVKDHEYQHLEGHLRRGLIVAPSNPEAFYIVGELAQIVNLPQFSTASFKRSLELDPRYLVEIHNSISGKMSLDDELKNVIPASGDLIVDLAKYLYDAKNDRSVSHVLAKHAIDLLSTQTDEATEAARHHSLGVAHRILGDFERAINEYRTSLKMFPMQSNWRMELTQILLEHQGVAPALREAEIGHAIVPNSKPFQLMVQELRRRNTPQPRHP